MQGMIDLIQKASFRPDRGCFRASRRRARDQRLWLHVPQRVMRQKMQCCLWSDALEFVQSRSSKSGNPAG